MSQTSLPDFPSKPPKFFSLFVPQKPDWFNSFLTQKVQELLERKKAKVFAHKEKELLEQVKAGKKTLTKEEKTWLDSRLALPKLARRVDLEKREPGSLSDYLIDLVVHDLRERKILSKKELEAYTTYAESKPDILKTQFKTKEVHSTFSLYLPSHKDQAWIREKLDTDFIKENCKVKSRSLYVWDLFVRANASELTREQLGEWKNTIAAVKAEKLKKSA